MNETRQRSSAASRELELNQHTIRQLNRRIQELQELFAAREQDHRFVVFCGVYVQYLIEKPDVYLKNIYDDIVGVYSGINVSIVLWYVFVCCVLFVCQS